MKEMRTKVDKIITETFDSNLVEGGVFLIRILEQLPVSLSVLVAATLFFKTFVQLGVLELKALFEYKGYPTEGVPDDELPSWVSGVKLSVQGMMRKVSISQDVRTCWIQCVQRYPVFKFKTGEQFFLLGNDVTPSARRCVEKGSRVDPLAAAVQPKERQGKSLEGFIVRLFLVSDFPSFLVVRLVLVRNFPSFWSTVALRLLRFSQKCMFYLDLFRVEKTLPL